MEREENSVNKRLYKIELCLIKFMPVFIASVSLINTILSYFKIDIPILSFIAGTSICTIIFMYISSYVFKFCLYHRIFIHYIAFNWFLNTLDHFLNIPLNCKEMIAVYLTIFGMCIIIASYIKFNVYAKTINY